MSLVIVIKGKGLAKLPGALKRFRIGIIARVPMMLKLAAQEVAAIAKQDYLSGPRSKDRLGVVSGDLRRSIEPGQPGNHFKLAGNRVVLGSNLPYAGVHEFGATIKAKASPFLVFKIGKNWISKKSVVIPARPFLTPALKDARPGIKSIIARMTNQALKEAMT